MNKTIIENLFCLPMMRRMAETVCMGWLVRSLRCNQHSVPPRTIGLQHNMSTGLASCVETEIHSVCTCHLDWTGAFTPYYSNQPVPSMDNPLDTTGPFQFLTFIARWLFCLLLAQVHLNSQVPSLTLGDPGPLALSPFYCTSLAFCIMYIQDLML